MPPMGPGRDAKSAAQSQKELGQILPWAKTEIVFEYRYHVYRILDAVYGIHDILFVPFCQCLDKLIFNLPHFKRDFGDKRATTINTNLR